MITYECVYPPIPSMSSRAHRSTRVRRRRAWASISRLPCDGSSTTATLLTNRAFIRPIVPRCVMDYERSRDGYFRARRILDAIRWDQYEEHWRAPVRGLFESVLDARAELEHDDVVAENSSHVAFHLAKTTGLLDAALDLREPLRRLGESPKSFADVYQAATWVLLTGWPSRYVARRLFFRGQIKPWRLYPAVPGSHRHRRCDWPVDKLCAVVAANTPFAHRRGGHRDCTALQ